MYKLSRKFSPPVLYPKIIIVKLSIKKLIRAIPRPIDHLPKVVVGSKLLWISPSFSMGQTHYRFCSFYVLGLLEPLFASSIYILFKACCPHLGCTAITIIRATSAALPVNTIKTQTPDMTSKMSHTLLRVNISRTFFILIGRPPRLGSLITLWISAGIPRIHHRNIATNTFIGLLQACSLFICSQRSASISCLILSRTEASSPAVYSLTQCRTIETTRLVMLFLAPELEHSSYQSSVQYWCS